MTKPLVSVVMITYNHELYIRKAIESILAQKTRFPFELLIGEDCSDDETGSIVSEYAQQHPDRIRVLTSSQNVGMKQNWYRTSMACMGKYMAYCEGDDYWQREDKLQMQVDYLESHPACGLVYSDYDRLIAEDMSKTSRYRRYSGQPVVESPRIEDILIGKAGILTCTVLARRELIQQILNADPHLHQSDHFKMGDTQLWAELSLLAAVHYMDESLATHIFLEESATRSRNLRKTLEFWISNTEMCLYLCVKHALPENLRNTHERLWRRKSLQYAFLEQRPDLADMVRMRSSELSPKDWIWYSGTKYPLLRPVVQLLQKIFQNN